MDCIVRDDDMPDDSTVMEVAAIYRAVDELSRRVQERTYQLATGRRMYKNLFEEVPCYLTVVDREYRIVRANRAFREQFGDRLGSHCYVGYKGADFKCEECPVAKTFADGMTHQSEEQWQVNGGTANVLVKTAPIFNDKHEIMEVIEMAVDLTKVRQLETQLEKRSGDYEYLFGNVPCYLTVVNRDFEIVRANKKFEDQFGPKVGQKCYIGYKERLAKCVNCPVEKTFIDGLSHESEEVWRRDGRESNIMVRTSPLFDESGNIVAVMEMSSDVTEVKRLQSELALLGETVAGMSHTIKNILAGLQGGVYVVDSGLARGREDRIHQGWDMVKRNVEKVSELVHGILYASKEREPEYTETDPAALLSEICELYDEKATSAGIFLVRDFGGEMAPGVFDPAGMHSAVSNLISNAIDACAKSDKTPRTVTVQGRVEGDTFSVVVSDNGTGMPEEVKEKLFGKFYSTKGGHGTGLGLVMTKKIVEEHGGTIVVESREGRGTTFRIDIPLHPGEWQESRKAVV
jgi:signal transduction histidine kinase